MEELLTVQEVAEYLKLSRSTIWRWCQQGKLNAFKLGHSWRIRWSDVNKLMQEQIIVGEDGESKLGQ